MYKKDAGHQKKRNKTQATSKEQGPKEVDASKVPQILACGLACF
jgi:hypothetical protein